MSDLPAYSPQVRGPALPEFSPPDLFSQGLAAACCGSALAFYVVSLFRTFAAAPRTGAAIELIAPIVIGACTFGLMAIGVTMVMSARGIDFSVPMVGLVGAAVAARIGLGALPALVLAGVVGVVLGAINGALVGGARIPSYVATFASAVVLGLLVVWLVGNTVVVAPGLAGLGGLGPALLLLIVGAGGTYAVLAATGVGVRLRSIGGGATVALAPVLMAGAFTSAGGLGGVAMVVREGSFQAVVGGEASLLLAFAPIAAALIGGASVYGGRGSVLGAVLGGTTVSLLVGALSLWRAAPVVDAGVLALLAIGFVLWDVIRRRWIRGLA